MNITVYGIPNCKYCTRAMNFLKENNQEFIFDAESKPKYDHLPFLLLALEHNK